MRRDWDVIREILIAFEQDRFIEYANSVTLSANEIILLNKQTDGIDEAERQEVKAGMLIEKRCEIWRHMELLQDCKLIVSTQFDTAGKNNCMRLSMLGHDFLDAMRDTKTWNRITVKAKEAGVSLTWETVKVALPLVIKDLITK